MLQLLLMKKQKSSSDLLLASLDVNDLPILVEQGSPFDD